MAAEVNAELQGLLAQLGAVAREEAAAQSRTAHDDMVMAAFIRAGGPEKAERMIADLYAKGCIRRTPDGYDVGEGLYPQVSAALSEHWRAVNGSNNHEHE